MVSITQEMLVCVPAFLKYLNMTTTAAERYLLGIANKANNFNPCSISSTFVQYLQPLFNIFNLCSISSTFVQYLQPLHNIFNLCTISSTFAQYLQSYLNIFSLT